jgi:Zn-finger nucleic acid-binding protein
MPLLMCPNCQSGMTSVQRSVVEFDMCPTCRGVWLDRGELEKLMSLDREAVTPAQSGKSDVYDSPQTYRPRFEDDHRRSGFDSRKRKRFDLFEIFD